MAGRYPEVRETLQDRQNLSVGAIAELVDAVRREIDELTAEPGWSHHWDDEGYTPDYSRVRDRLEALLAKGHADEVVALGEELLEAGTQQVEMSNDEGETASEIASCMEIVFRALSHASFSPAEQMFWAVKTELNDEYDLCQGAEQFWEEERTAADWNILVEKLTSLLNDDRPAGGEDSFSRKYHRDRLTNWLIDALGHAGRQEEILPLCEREAEETGSYPRLVNKLKEAGRLEKAEQWIHKSIKVTHQQWPGIANELRTALRGIREQANNWPRVAVFRAEDFFQQPSLHTFQELQKAAERAAVWPAVRAAALHYLETGELPQVGERVGHDRTIPLWPLPDLDTMDVTPRWQLHPR